MGCVVGPILFITFCADLGVLRGSLEVSFFGAFAIVIIAPVGGAACQAAHDLFVARRLGLLRLWDFLVFTAIAVAWIVAGEALYYGYGKQASADLYPFKNHTFDFTVAFILLILAVYAMSKSGVDWLSRQTWKAGLLKLWAMFSESEYSDWQGP